MSLSVLSALFVTVLGLVYTLATFALPEAAMGRPNEPKIFPAILGILLIILGAILLIQVIMSEKKEGKGEKLQFGQSEKQIALTIANGVVYSLLFNPIGYVPSTIIFVLMELFIFDGVKVWKKGLVISVLFSVIVYVIFDILLGIYLPPSPLGFI
ncbi:MAG: tripartite tricarboxylate transporter TctB family protein [Treponema sp.]|nr:tripartite tricarboxylate transporter TctB family protein [Treponema sp.]